MAGRVNDRELILGILLEINKEGQYSHVANRNTLDKYQYLDKQERAFITRVCEGTQEQQILIDYYINYFSTVKVDKMKPVIREILRSSVYQLLFMDHVPDSAVCNEAVKLAKKKGFYNLTGFVNGVLRKLALQHERVELPPREKQEEYLSIRYSMPVWLVSKWLEQYGLERTEKLLQAFLEERPLTVKIKEYLADKEEVLKTLEKEGVTVERAPYVENAYYLKNYDYLPALTAFRMGNIQVQDVSSMLVGEIAAPRENSYVLDLCAAPGGKAVCVADKLHGTGRVEARDVSGRKTAMILENAVRLGCGNLEAVVSDATVFDEKSADKADLVLADVPCSGLGVIGRKKDIKYKMTASKQKELILLQRKILENAACYVKPGGTLIYSTCTISQDENLENVIWFTKQFPFQLESIDSYLCEELKSDTTSQGFLQMLPGEHESDGFFIARLKRMK